MDNHLVIILQAHFVHPFWFCIVAILPVLVTLKIVQRQKTFNVDQISEVKSTYPRPLIH